MFRATHETRIAANEKMKYHEPPKRATPSATRSPNVAFSSSTSLAFLEARSESIRSVCRSRLPMTVRMSIAAAGWRANRRIRSSRSMRNVRVGSSAVTVADRGSPSKSDSSPKIPPFADLLQDHALALGVGDGHLDPAGEDDVHPAAGMAGGEDRLAGREGRLVDVGRQLGYLRVVEELEDRALAEDLRVERAHRPLPCRWACCARSIDSKSARKLPAPKPWSPFLWMISKKNGPASASW